MSHGIPYIWLLALSPESLLGIPWGLQVLLRHMAVLNSPAIFDGGRNTTFKWGTHGIYGEKWATWYDHWVWNLELFHFSTYLWQFEVCQMHSILLRKLNQVFFACFVLLGNGLEMKAILIKRGWARNYVDADDMDETSWNSGIFATSIELDTFSSFRGCQTQKIQRFVVPWGTWKIPAL